MAQWERIRLPMQETQETHEMQVQSLGHKHPPELEMATYSSILAWKIQQTEKPGGVTKI